MTGAPPTAARGSADGRLRRLGLGALIIGLGGLVAGAALAALDVRGALLAALFALTFWLGLPLGSAAMLMTHELTGGRWGWSVRRPLRAALAGLPLAGLLLIPVAAGAEILYPWTDAAYVEQHHLVQQKQAWLNLPFWLGRTGGFFVIWLAGAALLLGATRPARMIRDGGEGDQGPSRVDPRGARRHPGSAAALASAGLIIFIVTMTFAAWDWLASLEPRWYSSVFGGYIIIGQVLTALAIITLIAALAAHADPGLSGDRLHDLGNLMLAVVILHAYIGFTQYFIIWNGDVEATVLWYLPRTSGAWGAVAVGIMALHFFVPMVALLFRGVKRSARGLGAVAGLVLIARVLDCAWITLPAAEGFGPAQVAQALAAFVGAGGLALGAMFLMWRRDLAGEGAP